MTNLIFAVIAIFLLWQFVAEQGQGIEDYNYEYRSAVREQLWQPPEQSAISTASSVYMDEYKLTPLASFSVQAVVLHKKSYHFDRESDLSPLDLALGWGPMSEADVLKQIDISQYNRWYYWKTSNFPIPRRDIESHSANMHIIPADEWVESQVKDLQAGDAVRLQGELVRVEADDGWRWVSSLSRSDTGDGACEVFLVKRLQVLH